MKKATTLGLLMVFGLFLTLFWIQYDLRTSEVSLAHLTAKTAHSPVVYQQLKPETLTSLGIQEVGTTEQKSFFDSAAFLYTLLFMIVIIGVSKLYYKEAVKNEAAWRAFLKSLNEKEKS